MDQFTSSNDNNFRNNSQEKQNYKSFKQNQSDIDDELKDSIIETLKTFFNAPNNGESIHEKLEELNKELCEKTGLKPKTYQDIRAEYRDNLEADVAKMKAEFRAERLHNLLQSCEINPEWEFDKIKSVEAINSVYNTYDGWVNYCKNWVLNLFEPSEKGLIINNDTNEYYSRGSLVYIFGNYGVGKSMLAGAMAKLFIRTYLREADFYQWKTLFDKLTSLSYSDPKEYDALSSRIINVDLLILDEIAVGKRPLTEASQTRLGEILRGRKNKGRNTIIVSNANPEEIYALVGDFAYESILNYSPTVPVNLVGPNFRSSGSVLPNMEFKREAKKMSSMPRNSKGNNNNRY